MRLVHPGVIGVNASSRSWKLVMCECVLSCFANASWRAMRRPLGALAILECFLNAS